MFSFVQLIEEAEGLQQEYWAAYNKMLFVIEDSGWLLAAPGQEEAAAPDMVS